MKTIRLYISFLVEELRAPTIRYINGTALSPKVKEARKHKNYSFILF